MKQIPLYSKKPEYTQLRYIHRLAYCFQIINEHTQQSLRTQKKKRLCRKEINIQGSYITRTLTVFEIKKSLSAA